MASNAAPAKAPVSEEAARYIETFQMEAHLSRVVNAAIRARAADPLSFMGEWLLSESSKGTTMEVATKKTPTRGAPASAYTSSTVDEIARSIVSFARCVRIEWDASFASRARDKESLVFFLSAVFSFFCEGLFLEHLRASG